MKIDISRELVFGTARSGGKGGQNVNKVETMVLARWNIGQSTLVTEEQKARIRARLRNRINSEDELYLRSQTERTQQGNREAAVNRIEALVAEAVTVKRSRIATQPTRASVNRRLESKKRSSERKSSRGRVDPGLFL